MSDDGEKLLKGLPGAGELRARIGSLKRESEVLRKALKLVEAAEKASEAEELARELASSESVRRDGA